MSLNIISSTFSIHKKKSNLFFLNTNIFSTTMFSQKRKREPYTTLAQKLWLVKQREENKKISLARIAMDFSTEFNRPISISGISRIISQKDELLALSVWSDACWRWCRRYRIRRIHNFGGSTGCADNKGGTGCAGTSWKVKSSVKNFVGNGYDSTSPALSLTNLHVL